MSSPPYIDNPCFPETRQSAKSLGLNPILRHPLVNGEWPFRFDLLRIEDASEPIPLFLILGLGGGLVPAFKQLQTPIPGLAGLIADSPPRVGQPLKQARPILSQEPGTIGLV